MNKLFLLLIVSLFLQHTISGQSILELSPKQGMSVTGKGPGQDAAPNPYSNTNSFAVIENIGKNDFGIRIQEKGKLIKTVTVAPDEIKIVKLLIGYELYLDSYLKAKAKVDFKKDLNEKL